MLSVVPAGFAEYVRVFNPAYRGSGSDRAAVTWAEVAQANGKQMHPLVQFGSITGSERYETVRELAAPMGARIPSLWWPEDHAGCLATEVDFKTTYIGADRRCAQELVSLPAVEAATVPSDAGITALSDPRISFAWGEVAMQIAAGSLVPISGCPGRFAVVHGLACRAAGKKESMRIAMGAWMRS